MGLAMAPTESWRKRRLVNERGFADDIAHGQLAPEAGIGAAGGVVAKH